MTAAVKVIELCTSTLVQYHMNLLTWSIVWIITPSTWHFIRGSYWWGSVVCKKKSLRNIKCCAKCNCSNVQSTNTDILLEMFTFEAFCLLRICTRLL